MSVGEFNQDFALRVVGGCGVYSCPECLHKVGEGAAGELQSAVGDEVAGDPKPADPLRHKGVSDGGGVVGGEGDGLQHVRR